ncbi:MAG TPA: sugar phosphate isomerase/epimerase [Candidatus Hydrogenedentes bacterium]|jgi:sugar phosphate isomerase/epimerase|nr:sugar phosphate isomerase/epimerase [Candidatus Hydrogenedentota bacterium]MDY0031514.1 sugar phosphate isomerase/epimerase [FCB group bacterium]HNV22428.1 sugar phosphate isomerase/epimerase [Candidatus Hydrogenedentota bacterium]HNZ19926.1 sugar phosphate isomerase/epimerase [Candidatus Hydrogenedentota bacterium]HOH35408.1 sugar phosphate isomerase/epimerase [Candidatus Hydrogenedentota bacterium]
MAEQLTDLSRLCIHTITTRPWSLEECLANYRKAGVPAVTVWRQWLEPQGLEESARMLQDSGLRVTSLCRGGFFPALSEDGRKTALDDNRRAIAEAHAIGAPLIVLVCGAVPGMPLSEARKQIAEGIAAVLPEARAAGVKLSIEPLHPMFSDARSAVNSLTDANDMAAELDDGHVGVTVDVYHVWWDSRLEAEIRRAGRRILSFHVCDWRTPTRDLLNDRGLMGEGCIDIRSIRSWVEQAGFKGDIEVEIFSDAWWATDQHAFLEKITAAYLEHC